LLVVTSECRKLHGKVWQDIYFNLLSYSLTITH